MLWFTLAWSAPQFHFSRHGALVAVDAGRVFAVDIDDGRLMEVGDWAELEDKYAAEVGSRADVKGEVVERNDLSILSTHRGQVRVMNEVGYELWRAALPAGWGDRYTQGLSSREAALLYDGRTAVLYRDDFEDFELVDVGAGHGRLVQHPFRDLALFNGRPDTLWTWKEGMESRPFALVFDDDVRWAGDVVVGANGNHALGWNESDGEIRFILPVPDLGQRRLSADGTVLGRVIKRRFAKIGQLVDTEDGTTLAEWKACSDTVWPLESLGAVEICGDVVHLRAVKSRALGGLPSFSSIRHVARVETDVRVVGEQEDGSVAVWRVPVDGSGAYSESFVGAEGDRAIGYEDGRPITLQIDIVDGRPVEVATAEAYRKLSAAAASDGVDVRINSGFRTWSEQDALYQCYLSGDCNGGNLAARPGHSNHQSGLALDLNTRNADVRAWLEANAAEFGFVRTVRGEPWHYEYIFGTRTPAVSVAALPPAEPTFKRPRTPWTLPGDEG